MALPQSQKLRVKIIAVLLVLWVEFPLSREKCIFDGIQAQLKLVTGTPFQQHNLPNERQTGGEHQGQLSQPVRSTRDLETQHSKIRIRTWLSEESYIQSEEKQRLETAVEEAIRTVSSLLSVNRVTGPLLLKRDINKYCKFLWKNSSSVNYNRCGRANKYYRNETCLDVTIPDEHLEGCDIYPDMDSTRRTVLRPKGTGLPDTDFVLYLHVQATDKCRAEPKVRAYAVHCQTDTRGRPVAGVVVTCREKLTGVAYNHQATVQTVIHELFHVLGFSKKLFDTWRDCSSTSPSGCSVRGKMIRSDALGQMRIYTQAVTSALQKHLGTTDPDIGGPLENMDASPNGVSSHWESRVMQGSIMAAVLGDPATVRIDPVTLAALQETGWYTADINQAQDLVWGGGEGSMFGSPSTCKDNSSTFFCTGSGLGCHYLHLHKGQCQTDSYLDGCRIYKPIHNGSECWRKENFQQAAQEEIFGCESRCFFSSLTKQDGVNTSLEGRCYKHRCTGLNQFQVQVYGSDWMDCPAGGAVQVKGYQGSIWCPNRRLCLPSVAALSLISFRSFNTSDPNTTKNQRVARSTSAQLVITTLVIISSVCPLALVLTISYRCCKVRIHSMQNEPNLQQASSSVL